MDSHLRTIEKVTGLLFLVSGGLKLAGKMQGEFERFGYPRWFRIATGVVEVSAGASLALASRNPIAVTTGGLLAGTAMVGALWTHLVVAKDSPAKALPAAALLLAAAYVIVREAPDATAAIIGKVNCKGKLRAQAI